MIIATMVWLALFGCLSAWGAGDCIAKRGTNEEEPESRMFAALLLFAINLTLFVGLLVKLI